MTKWLRAPQKPRTLQPLDTPTPYERMYPMRFGCIRFFVFSHKIWNVLVVWITCPCLQKLLHIKYFMKSACRVPVFNQRLLNLCCTSAQLSGGNCLGKKTNDFLWFQRMKRYWNALEMRPHESRYSNLTFLRLCRDWNTKKRLTDTVYSDILKYNHAR